MYKDVCSWSCEAFEMQGKAFQRAFSGSDCNKGFEIQAEYIVMNLERNVAQPGWET